MSRYSRSRRANSSLPGHDNLGWESFNHPASKSQPSADDYGIDSEFGEGVRKGPYRSGPAPASYGWSPDHPATHKSLEQDFDETHDLHDANLKKAMERKASKCIEIAENRLGKYASQEEIEELALRYMDLPSRSINAKLNRIAAEQFAGDEMQEATGYEGEDMGPGNVMADDIESEMVSPAEVLAEEIAMLKAANQRLAAELRRVAEDVVQKGTGYEGHDESEDSLDDSESEGPTSRLAHDLFDEYDLDDDDFISEGEWGGSSDAFDAIDEDMDGMISRGEGSRGVGSSFAQQMDTLSEIMAEAHEAGDEETMAEVLATMEMVAGRTASEAPKSRRKQSSDFLAEDILSDAEFAEMVAELEMLAGGKGSGGNNKGTRKVINQYGEAAPGFGYQDPDVRAKNRANRDSDWNKKTKMFYNKNYYSKNRGEIEGWPTPENPRVAEMTAEDVLTAEEDQMLAEMLAEMNMAEEHDATMMAEEHDATMMAGAHDATMMAGAHDATMMAEAHDATMMAEAHDHMGLDVASEEAGIDPKLARIFQAAEEEASEEEASEEEATKKSASFRPQTTTRQASVKTLGNISREASSATDELSKLWESAPDVSKYFG